MEKIIRLEGTEDTPNVILDKSANLFEISGRSLPENAVKFYAPLLEWMDEYIKDPNPSTEVIVNLDYFNSSSTIQVFEFLLRLQQLKKAGKEVKVVWIYDQNDELMEAEGLEIKGVLDLPFEMRTNN